MSSTVAVFDSMESITASISSLDGMALRCFLENEGTVSPKNSLRPHPNILSRRAALVPSNDTKKTSQNLSRCDAEEPQRGLSSASMHVPPSLIGGFCFLNGSVMNLPSNALLARVSRESEAISECEDMRFPRSAACKNLPSFPRAVTFLAQHTPQSPSLPFFSVRPSFVCVRV